jgi:hypothetical protein
VPCSRTSKPLGSGCACSKRPKLLQSVSLTPPRACSQVTVPLPVPGQLPLSISLMSLHKKDLTLLQAAAKLGPMLAEEAAKLAAAPAQPPPAPRGGARQAGTPAAAAAAAAGSPAGAAAAKKGGNVKAGKKGGKGGASEEQAARAEAFKEDGNAAFKSGRFEEAVRHYSSAVQLDPKNHVYYANRCVK